MAYQTRQRDPFLDSQMQAMIEKRGRELIGLVLVTAGIALAMMLWSYAPGDPNWLAATDDIPENLFGRFGASVSAVLMMIVGYGSWLIVAAMLVWGTRFLLHRGAELAMTRGLFVPIAVSLAAVYAASYPPGESWTHSFGLGGLFGDTVLAAILNILPVGIATGLRVTAAAAFVSGIALTFFVFGATRSELRLGLRWMLYGLILVFHGLVGLLRGVGSGGLRAAASWREARAARAEAAEEDWDEARMASELPAYGAVPTRREPVLSGGNRLLARVPILRAVRGRDALAGPEPELVSRDAADFSDIEPPSDDRIREKIADVIRARLRRPAQVDRVEPPLTAGGMPAPAPIPPAPGSPIPSVPDELDEPDTWDDDWHEEDAARIDLSAAERIDLPHSERNASISGSRPKVVPPASKPAPSRRALADAQPSLPLEDGAAYEFPPLTLLSSPANVERHHLSDEALEENARMLESVLDDYGVKGEIVSVRPGPVVTMYELEPAPGLKASRVIGLADDIARSMSALSARVSTVPGRSVIGIELPNQHREKVVLREILSSRDYGDGNHRLPLALGKDIGGEAVIANLAKMPHLLIAGTTGSGKSVAINTMILSLLYKLPPEDCRLIMIDPKMLELSVYDGIPHLLSPVVTDPKKAVVALKWVVGEMEERYRKMSKMGVRNIDGYNGRVADALAKGEMFKRTIQTGFDDETGEPVFETEEFHPEKMPFIVVVVDEMADLMMVAGKEIEACIQRLAQMARASGIHLIMATQRPSVDVITGTIKANFPTRISFHVTSKIDSRTILGEMGAEQLLGQGDMLYMAGGSKITRVHGPFVSDEEVEEIVRHLKSFGPPDYAASVLDGPDDDRESDIDAVLGLNTGGNTDGEDALYDQAVQIVIKDRKCSTSYIQRKLAIGYNKAARLVEQMEEQGLVSAANHVGKREILVPEPA
ncbi:DNA translocase FtsK [Rhodobacterales bacterium HKCCE3408]|nr:DNA translocase FtsK [Rhodobacterales bacterium HKCCE3408]